MIDISCNNSFYQLQLYILCSGIKGSKGDSLFTDCVSELVLESRNFDLLLGRLEPDGTRTQGFLNHFKGTQVKFYAYHWTSGYNFVLISRVFN